MSDLKHSITVDANPEGINQYSEAAHTAAAYYAGREGKTGEQNNHRAEASEHKRAQGEHNAELMRQNYKANMTRSRGKGEA